MSVQSQLVCFIQEIKGFTIKVLQLCCVVKYSLKYILSIINSSGKQSKLRKNITLVFPLKGKTRSYYELEHDGSIPFLGTVLTKSGGTLTTEVYRKPTDSGLLLHFQSHVDSRYKKDLESTRWLTVCTVYLPPMKVLQKKATSYTPCFRSCAIRKHWSIPL